MARKGYCPESVLRAAPDPEFGLRSWTDKRVSMRIRFTSGKRDTARSALLKSVRLNELRDQNTRLKGLVADLTLDKVMLQDVLSKKAEAGQAKGFGRRTSRAVRCEPTLSCHDIAFQSILAGVSPQA